MSIMASSRAHLPEKLGGKLRARLSFCQASPGADRCVDEPGLQPSRPRPLGAFQLRAERALLEEAQGAARVQHLVRGRGVLFRPPKLAREAAQEQRARNEREDRRRRWPDESAAALAEH